MVTISANATVGVHGWTALDRSGMTSQKTKNDFLVEVDQTFIDSSSGPPSEAGGGVTRPSTVKSRRKLPGCFTLHRPLSSKLFAVSPDAKFIFSGGHWDNSLQTFSGLATVSIFFCFIFVKVSPICQEGKSMAPRRRNNSLFRFYQQLPRLRLVCCFWNYREKRTLSGVPC